MKSSVLFSFSLFLIVELIHAQNYKVTTGVIEYQAQNYEEAINNLESAPVDLSHLKEKKYLRLYLLLGVGKCRNQSPHPS